MSSNHLNLYVIRNSKGLNSFETLCASMFGPKKGKLNQKAQLTQLREMSIYLSAVTSMDESVFTAITAYLKELSDSDVDRKLFRTAIFLLTEAIVEFSARGELANRKTAIMALNSVFDKDLKQKSGSRQLLIWRTIGSIAHVYSAQAKVQYHIGTEESLSLASQSVQMESYMKSRLSSTFEDLQYPVKQKKSVLFGEDKDFLPKLLTWAAVLSGLVRCGEGLPSKCWDNLAHGLTCTAYKPLAQHAFRLLLNTAKETKDPKSQLDLINQLLAGRDSNTAGKEPLNLADSTCCMYYIRTIAALAHNCRDLQAVDPAAATAASAPAQSAVLKAVVELLVSSLHFLDSEVKIVTEMVAMLVNKQDGCKIVHLCTQQLRLKAKRGTPKADVIAMITQALVNHLTAQEQVGTMDSTDLPALLRACEAVGRFMVERTRPQHKDADSITNLWKALRRHYLTCLLPKDDAVGSDAQRAGRGASFRQLRSAAGASQSGASCVGYNSPSYWSWPAENPSVATAAASQNPHILCALLRAQIWMAPDKRFFPKEHKMWWSVFADNLLTSSQLIITTLARDFDILSFLLPVLSQLFARVQASTASLPPAPAQAQLTSTAASILDMDASTAATSAGVTEVHVHYQPVYVDVLLAMAEQFVAATRCGMAVTFLQSVWQWLGAFTSARAHPQQAALQQKRDLAAQSAASLGNNGLLLPTTTGAVSTAASSDATADAPYTQHADRALLQSIVRMTLLAQQEHTHIATAPTALGTSSPVEGSRIMHDLHISGLWHLADKAALCFSMTVGASNGSDFSSHADAVSAVIKILGCAASQIGVPNNVCNSATMGLVKVASMLLLRADVDKNTQLALLRGVARELAAAFMASYSCTLDLSFRHLLLQALPSTSRPHASETVEQEAGDKLLMEILSHIFAQKREGGFEPATTSVYSTLRGAMQVVCAFVQSGGSSGSFTPAMNAFLVAYADVQHNSFAFIVPAPYAASAEEAEEAVEDEEVEEATAPDAVVEDPTAVAAPKASAQLFSFDDDFLGGWAPTPSTVPLAPTKSTAAPVMSTGGSLLDDLWLMDAPLEPTKPSTGVGAFDLFGSSSAPLIAAPATAAVKPATKPAAGAGVPFLAPPPQKRPSVVLFRDIYDEDEPMPANKPDVLDFSPTKAPSSGASATNDFASTPFTATPPTAVKAAASGGFDWPGASAAAPSAVAGDLFGGDFFASTGNAAPATMPAAMDWPGVTTAAPSVATSPGVAPNTTAPAFDWGAIAEPRNASAVPASAAAGMDWPGVTTVTGAGVASSGDAAFTSAQAVDWGAALDLSNGSAVHVQRPAAMDWPGVTTTAPAADGFNATATSADMDFFTSTVASTGTTSTTTAAAATGAAWPDSSTVTSASAPSDNFELFGDNFSSTPAETSTRRTSTGAAPVPGSLETLSKEEVAAIAAAKRASIRASVKAVVAQAYSAAAIAATAQASASAPASLPVDVLIPTPSTTAPAAVNDWPVASDSVSTNSASTPAPVAAGGWGEIPGDFGSSPSAAASTPEPPRRVGTAPVAGSLETLSKSDVAAIAAAKRATRRQSTVGTVATAKAVATGSLDPFFNAPAPALLPASPAAPSADLWATSSTTAPAPSAAAFPSSPDPFASTPAPASAAAWPETSSQMFAPTTASASAGDGFQATSADFAPTAAAPGAAPQSYPPYPDPAGYPPAYQYPPAAPYPGYAQPPAYGNPAGYPAAAPYYPPAYSQQPPGGYGAPPPQYAYPPQTPQTPQAGYYNPYPQYPAGAYPPTPGAYPPAPGPYPPAPGPYPPAPGAPQGYPPQAGAYPGAAPGYPPQYSQPGYPYAPQPPPQGR